MENEPLQLKLRHWLLFLAHVVPMYSCILFFMALIVTCFMPKKDSN